MNDRQTLLRHIPRTDALIARCESEGHVRALGRAAVAEICREALERAKARAVESGEPPDAAAIAADIDARCRAERAHSIRRVVNGTGVLLHTNLGRAPLGNDLLQELCRAIGGYCNLEIDVRDRRRGQRGRAAIRLLAQLCEAEDALVVNNNAASLFLVLHELARGREVVVSRSELVQIGGGFRIPEILEASGATLREVGTTNITTVDDYRRALNDRTAAVLKVHQANFRMEGFVESPTIADLRAGLGDALLVSDLGSGCPVSSIGDRALGEPTPARMLGQGADLVCFSGDKMLGAVQAGVVAGRAALVERLRRAPVMRALRPDKVALAALEIVARHHLAGDHERVLLWAMASADPETVRRRAERFIKDHGLDPRRFAVVDSTATFGGGSTPGRGIPSAALRVTVDLDAEDVARRLQESEPPVVATIRDGRVEIDFRTVLPEDEPALAAACLALDTGPDRR